MVTTVVSVNIAGCFTVVEDVPTEGFTVVVFVCCVTRCVACVTGFFVVVTVGLGFVGGTFVVISFGFVCTTGFLVDVEVIPSVDGFAEVDVGKVGLLEVVVCMGGFLVVVFGGFVGFVCEAVCVGLLVGLTGVVEVVDTFGLRDGFSVVSKLVVVLLAVVVDFEVVGLAVGFFSGILGFLVGITTGFTGLIV